MDAQTLLPALGNDHVEYSIELALAPIISRNHNVNVKKDRVMGRIRQAFDDNIPFFTRDALGQISLAFNEALLSGQQSQSVSVTGIDDVSIEFQILPEGQVYEHGYVNNSAEHELTIAEPCLGYQTVEKLLYFADTLESFNDTATYLPLVVHHQTRLQNKQTKEIVPLWPLPTYDIFKADFQETYLQWRTSDESLQLQSSLYQNAALIPRSIHKLVAFACSSMTIPDGGNKNSMLQHALVLSVREFLVDRNGEDEHGGVRCYAQDPMYTSLDQKLLKEIGVEVLADPRAFLEADETSVVFSFSPDIPVRQIITDIGRPAILVWNFVGEPRVALCTDPISSRVKNMIEREYINLDIQLDKEHFGNIAIYMSSQAALVEVFLLEPAVTQKFSDFINKLEDQRQLDRLATR